MSSANENPEDAALGDAMEVALARRVLRKIDIRLIPLLSTTYMLNFMDKTILSSASVFGLSEDTVRFRTHRKQGMSVDTSIRG